MKKTVNFILLTLIGFTSLNVYSQTKDDAGEAYNEGIQYVKAEDFNNAIASFEKAISICETVGIEADEIKDMAAQQLPAICYKSATNMYKSKEIDESIKQYEKTIELAQKYNNEGIEKKAKKMIPQLYNYKGSKFIKQKDYDNALKQFEIAIQKDPEFAKAYYSKGLVYNKLKEPVKMKESFDLAVEKAEASGDMKTLERTKKAAKKCLTNFAVASIQKEKNTEALNYLKQAGEYGEGNANYYYYNAIVYNKLKDWDNALESANKALELERDSKEVKAKIYFELGNAYYGKGDNDAACKAYKEALYGDYVEQANYQIKEVLKCK